MEVSCTVFVSVDFVILAADKRFRKDCSGSEKIEKEITAIVKRCTINDVYKKNKRVEKNNTCFFNYNI